jgi:hypothetical protein
MTELRVPYRHSAVRARPRLGSHWEVRLALTVQKPKVFRTGPNADNAQDRGAIGGGHNILLMGLKTQRFVDGGLRPSVSLWERHWSWC